MISSSLCGWSVGTCATILSSDDMELANCTRKACNRTFPTIPMHLLPKAAQVENHKLCDRLVLEHLQQRRLASVARNNCAKQTPSSALQGVPTKDDYRALQN